MSKLEAAPENAQPVAAEIRDNLLEPFIAAARAALAEMAGIEPVVTAVYCQRPPRVLGEIAAVFTIRTETEGALVFVFPQPTAAALARRITANLHQKLDETLICDCAGEIANVIAGQAKALLAESPYRLAFVMPQIVMNAQDFHPPPQLDCLVVVFGSEDGAFAIQLFVELSRLANPSS